MQTTNDYGDTVTWKLDFGGVTVTEFQDHPRYPECKPITRYAFRLWQTATVKGKQHSYFDHYALWVDSQTQEVVSIEALAPSSLPFGEIEKNAPDWVVQAYLSEIERKKGPAWKEATEDAIATFHERWERSKANYDKMRFAQRFWNERATQEA